MKTVTIVATLFVASLGTGSIATALAQDVALQTRDQRRDQTRQRAREQAERARQLAEEQRGRQAQQRRDRLDAERGPEFTEQFSRTVRLGRNGTFDLANVAGDIVITGGGGDDVKIDAVKRVRQRTEPEARAILQQIEIRVSERSGQVDVQTEFPRRNNFWGSVDYRIALPNSANVTVRTVSGDLHVTNVRGELRADTVSGDVTAASIGKVRWLKSVSGDVQLSDAEGDDITAGTVSGDIDIRNLKARSIDLDLVSGDIRFTGVNAERATLKTISGDIDYAGQLARSGRYQMQSQSGDIHLTPSGNIGFDLDATSFSGDIRSDYTLRNTIQPVDNRRGPRIRTLRGTSGNGGAVITLRSFNGDITISRQ
jgi:DUF4097 and DUF4098 domain-containing protein YvlB